MADDNIGAAQPIVDGIDDIRKKAKKYVTDPAGKMESTVENAAGAVKNWASRALGQKQASSAPASPSPAPTPNANAYGSIAKKKRPGY